MMQFTHSASNRVDFKRANWIVEAVKRRSYTLSPPWTLAVREQVHKSRVRNLSSELETIPPALTWHRRVREVH